MVSWNQKNTPNVIVDVLLHDGILLAESDTVLGLFAQLSEESKKKLDQIKQRNLKPYIVLISSIDKLDQFIDQTINQKMKTIMAQYWPGPLTIIFKARADLPAWIKSPEGTIAIRIPDHQGLQNVLAQVDGIFTTSANISDQPLPNCYDAVNKDLLEQVQLVCCQKDRLYDGPASTILDFSSETIKIVRLGAVIINSI